MRYCIDTSSIIDAWVRWYPPAIFPGVWSKLDGLIKSGELISSEEVLREIERKEDELFAWAKKRESAFLPLTDAVQRETQSILASFKKMMDGRPGKSVADPFVIATARVTRTIVVTGEKATGNPERPKIPDVCSALQVECIGITAMFAREKWSF